MADTNALILIEEAVSRYMLKYKKGTEDYVTYLEHACNLMRDFRTKDAQEARSEKIAVDSLGIIEMPDDLITLKDVCVAKNGEWWSFTERPLKVNTTTLVGLVETQDSTFGEGVNIRDNLTTTYGARGAVNDYYYMVDWTARRIFCDGIKSDTVMLRYVSSGISTTGTTYMPDMLTETLDNYLLWKETYWIADLIRERESRKNDYKRARLEVRNVLNALTASQWKDLFWGSFNQNPKR